MMISIMIMIFTSNYPGPAGQDHDYGGQGTVGKVEVVKKQHYRGPVGQDHDYQ